MARIACPYCQHIQIFDQDQLDCEECGARITNQFLKAVTQTPPIYLATAGFTQHGKTTYLDSLMTMIENLGKISDRTYHEYMDDYTFRMVQDLRYQQEKRIKADSTSAVPQQPLLIGLHNFADYPVHPLIMYDVGGEVFDPKFHQNKTEKASARYFEALKHVHTIWFFVSVYDLENPEAISSERADHEDETFIRSLADLFVIYRNNMEQEAISLRGRNLLIVYTKADKIVDQLPFEVREYIRSDKYVNLPHMKRSEALEIKPKFDPDKYLEGIKAVSTALREWTYDVEGGTPFLNMVDESGMNVIFTVTSSIGRERGRSVDREIEYRRYRVLDPLLWAIMNNLAIGGDRNIALILDSSIGSKQVYANDLPFHVFNYLSNKGKVTTYYLGQVAYVSRAGARPPDAPSEEARPSLIGPILDTLDEETLVIIILSRPNHVIGEDEIHDLDDYATPSWKKRMAVFAFQDGLVEWERTSVLQQVSQFGEMFEKLFPRLND